MLSFKDYSKVLLRLSKVTDELHHIDKMTGGEFLKWTEGIPPQTIHQLGLPIPRHTEPRRIESNFFGN